MNRSPVCRCDANTFNTNCELRIRRRLGASLIDVAVGAAVLSLLLIPAMKMMGASATRIADIGLHDSLLFEAERAIEMTKIDLCDVSVFDSAKSLVDAKVADNHTTNVRTQVELASDPDVPALLTIVATAYQDINGNRRPDAGEPQESLRTQWSRP
ncbi:hypothetical protein [Aporhodopirellula aestuarii]|uniref:Uncharacterized protein n=1 Tax=Aporhodopirellula aestuarii TaxID=2950107 RepID=A0ABT0TZD3_9BACT|nr:hypothetical protein [Aporhodopirellula aestuarii]MCM2369744.1 hypothetical protein [Aporhodopirellula aestuarii]